MGKPNPLPPPDVLRSLLSYDPATGVFRWRAGRKGVPASRGGIAGGLCHGRLVICVLGIRYEASRLAWLYMTGRPPEAEVDHRDVDCLNNRWANLRAATRSQNNANRKTPPNTIVGLKGVQKRRKKWVAKIKAGGVQKYLGTFDTPEAAHEAYTEAARAAFGEFARP